MSRTHLQWSDNQAAQDQAEALCELGRDHAREWLKNPSGKHLALFRIEMMEEAINSCEWIPDGPPIPGTAAESILHLLAVYTSGMDEALHEFVMLAKSEPVGPLQ